MARYPDDRFDEPQDAQLRVGAHRAAPKKGRGWIAFGWAALATAVLIIAGVTALTLATGSGLPFTQSSTAPAASTTPPQQTAEPKLDPDLVISILNGTPTRGLANQVGDDLVAEGWDGAAVGVGSRANASSQDIDKTVVYYSDPADEAAARALALALKVGDVVHSDDFPGSPVTILIGSDYRPGV
jgi:hypothetical protein